MTTDYDYIWKIMVCGMGGVGKTTLIHRFLYKKFLQDTRLTIGVEMHTQIIPRQGRNISLVLWDLGGEERFRFIQPSYMRGASAAFVCFDMSRYSTFTKIRAWVDLIRENSSKEIPIALIGTKVDLVASDDFTTLQKEAEALVKELGLVCYIPTSSKWGNNVNEAILYVVDLLILQAYQHEHSSGLSKV
ncbi:MAG: Rab family GTPase [Candidatus Hodarchaeota archaeon]